MTRRVCALLMLVLGVLLTVAEGAGLSSMASPSHVARSGAGMPSAERAAIASSYGHLPLSFEVNVGQDADPAVRFVAHSGGVTLALAPSEALLSLWRQPVGGQHVLPGQPMPTQPSPNLVGMRWLGANPHPVVTGEDALPGTVNYFIGNDPAKWHTDIATYQQVRLHNVYPGVDLVYYGTQGRLEYDFVVAPGADPTRISLGFTGAQRMGMDLAGNLSLSLPGGSIAQEKPLIYQQTAGGARMSVTGGYTLARGGRVGFALGAYDPHLPLVIDPAYDYSTFFGGSGGDGGQGIAVDASGNTYVVGVTNSTNLPITVAVQPVPGGGADAFVMKVNATGNFLMYSSYLGGSGVDVGAGIAVDGSGNAYLTGFTQSSNFPLVAPFQPVAGGLQDAFAAKINPTGTTLLYSTYLGGTANDVGTAIAVDSTGDAYLTGGTNSPGFPTSVGAFQPAFIGGGDAFVTKLNPNGMPAYSTFLGGGGTQAQGIAIDSAGNAYITGQTKSTFFPVFGPAQATNGGGTDAFVFKLNPGGSGPIYSTYLGGSADDVAYGIALDAGGNAYVTGSTQSPNFPVINPLQPVRFGIQNPFVTKLNAAGNAFVYSTYLDGVGSPTDQGSAIAVDSAGDAYVTGFTGSANFPLANPLQSTLRGPGSAFVSKLNASGSLLNFSTYLGGSSGPDQGNGIAVGAGGLVYITGFTNSPDFPIVNPLISYYSGAQDAFITKIETLPTPVFTPGVFRPSSATFLLHNANASGVADASATFGAGTDVPVVGDWTGKGYRSIGVFRNGSWFLRNSNTTGGANISLNFGTAGDLPVVGDWTGKGYDSVGIYRPSNGTFYLRNSNTTGGADISFAFGASGDIPIAGDWTGKGYDSVGVYRQALGVFLLRNTNQFGIADLTFFFGTTGDVPVAGDWMGKGTDTVGVYRPSSETFYLRNSNTSSIYADFVVAYGASGDKPLVGQWILQPGSSKPSPRGIPAARQAALPRQAASMR